MNRIADVAKNISFIAMSVFALAMCVGVNLAGAQAPGTLSQLDGRASAALKAQVALVADSIARAGLPVAPLVDKTLEGISKGANDQRILVAVRGIAAELGVARRALGPSSDDELTAAIAALRAGSGAAGLAELRRTLPGRPLVVPLSVLASLLVDGAPAASALVAVVANARRRDDVDLLAYGRDVSRDVARGVAPITALSGTVTSMNAAAFARPGTPSLKPSSPAKPKP